MAKENRESKSEEAQILIREPIEPNDFLVKDFSEAEEKRLFDFLQTKVFYTEGESEDFGFADFEVVQTDSGNLIIDPKIYISKDYFIVGEEDYSDLIPIIIRHECYEVWVQAKTVVVSRDEGGDGEDYALAHERALEKEFEYAFEIGKAEKYMEFFCRCAEKGIIDKESLAEAQENYDRAKKMHKRKIAKNKN